MAPEPESETSKRLRSMSISGLISELRDSFLSRDFDRVEEELVAREARLRAELEEKNREIGFLREKISLESLKKINVELELKRLREKEKGCSEKLVKSDNNNSSGFGLGGGIVVKSEKKCKADEGVVEVEEGGKVGVFLGEERGDGVLENWKGKKVVGINGSVLLKRNGGGIGASGGGKLGMESAILIEDSDEDECNPQATLNKKETTSSTTIINNSHKSSSSGAPQKNLLTGLAENIGNIKRKFVSSRELDTNINALNNVDSDSSYSSDSSSSSAGPFDLGPPTSNKKLRADAASLGLNFSQR